MTQGSTPSVRDRLLAAGVAILSRSGFNGCSVQDITDAAGVPKGSFYNHFNSKEALGAAALAHFWNDGACPTLEILTDTSLAPLARLRAYFERGAAELVAANFTCGCLVGNMTAEMSDHSAVVSAQIAAIYAGWVGRVASCIQAAQMAGEIANKTSADQLARFTLSTWEGALLWARIEKGERPLRQFIETIFSQILL
ncbi:MAG TPA: TetR family transcriptional regulator C-terminal domain-containing protein [Acetobacteraceae bacterium]|jgi:TetR/AcrR family transcriptional repressor of nem operon